jgi:hypothetical protein
LSQIETKLSNLANDNPKELSRILISPSADINTLSIGAEILGGEVADEQLVLPVFRKLLKHINAVVREGAMIGVSAFYASKSPPTEILDRLKLMLVDDPSPNIKNYASALLEDFAKPKQITTQLEEQAAQ